MTVASLNPSGVLQASTGHKHAGAGLLLNPITGREDVTWPDDSIGPCSMFFILLDHEKMQVKHCHSSIVSISKPTWALLHPIFHPKSVPRSPTPPVMAYKLRTTNSCNPIIQRFVSYFSFLPLSSVALTVPCPDFAYPPISFIRTQRKPRPTAAAVPTPTH